MKEKTKKDIILLTTIGAVYVAWVFILPVIIPGYPILSAVFLSIVFTMITLMIIGAIKQIIWRIENGVDVFATLKTDPEDVKSRMLFVMQWGHQGGIVGALKEFNDIFRNYPQWRLQDWEVFRAWYKHEIDHMVENPKIYHMTMKDDGGPYNKDIDPLYDPDAPDWEQFERDHSNDIDPTLDYYDDEDDYSDDEDDYSDDEDDYTGRRKSLRDDAEEGLYIGLGIGMGLGATGAAADGVSD